MTEHRPDQDDTVLAMLAAGDKQAMKILFVRYYDLLFVVVNKYINNPEDTDDLIQDLFINIWSKKNTLHLTKTLARYLLKSALNRTRNVIRDKGRSPEILWDPHTLPENENTSQLMDACSNLDIREIIRLEARAKQRMSPRVRFTYMLRRKMKLTNPQIAAHLGITVKGVEKNMSVAMRILKDIFKSYFKILVVISILNAPGNEKSTAHQKARSPYRDVRDHVVLQIFSKQEVE